MPCLLRSLFVGVLFGATCICVAAEDSIKQDAALLSVSSELKHLDFVWARAEGDLNGDTISDVALVLTGQKGDGPREERLVVLTGSADGGYEVFSLSGELCHPSKFYNLDIREHSVFVQAVEYADSARFSGFTLQFRYSAARQDLELIGEQIDEENYDENSLYRVSINYLTKTAIHTRDAGKRHKEAMAQLTTSLAILPLQQFDCGNRSLPESPLYIDEEFKVYQEKTGAQ